MPEIFKTPDGWRCAKQQEHLHRAKWMDYQDPAIIMLTLVTTDRLPLLGELVGEGICLTPLGEFVAEEIRHIPTYKGAAGIEVYFFVVMPDHVHILLRIHDRLPLHLGHYIRWFKRQCTLACTALGVNHSDASPTCPALGVNHSDASPTCPALGVTSPSLNTQHPATCPALGVTSPSLNTQHPATCPDLGVTSPSIVSINKLLPFAPEYHDRVLTHRGQLANMARYIQDNPRRLALRRANKELFKIHQDIRWGELRSLALGNIFLADYPLKSVVKCSRRLTQAEIDEQKAQCLSHAEEGVVHITASISEGEKQIARALREAGYPLIVLLQEGFPKPDSPHYRYFKPKGVYFEACAAGKLLLLEPYPEALELSHIVALTEEKVGKIPHITQRYRFVAMNVIAEQIVAWRDSVAR